MGYLPQGMSDQTSEAFAYIRHEYNDVKGRVELQRHVIAQLQWSKEMQVRQKRLSTHCWTMKRVSCASWTTCEKWLGDKLEECHASLSAQNVTTTRHSRHWQLAVKEVNPLPRYLLAAMTSTSTRTSGLIN